MNPKKKIRAVKEKKEPRWKREHKNEEVKKRFRLVKTWLLLFAIFALLGISFKAWQSYRHRVWDGESRINLAIASEKTYLLSLDPASAEMALVEIPSQTQVEVAFSRGFYPIDSIFELSQLEEEEGLLLAQTLENNFGVPVKAWVYFPNKIDPQKPKPLLNQIIYSAFKGRTKTNLTNWDLVRLLLANNRVHVYKANFFDLERLNLLAEAELPDKTHALVIDKDRLDAFVQNNFQERKIRLENLTVEVVNSTQSPGLAESGARLLTNIGFEVSGFDNQEGMMKKCLFIGDNQQKGFYSTKWLREIFDCDWQSSEEKERADLILILGEEYEEQF